MRRPPGFLKNVYAVFVVALTGLVLSVVPAAARVAAPTIDSSTPLSPANNNDPTLNGTSGAQIVLVTIHRDSACSSRPLASGRPVDGHFAIKVHVADNTSTTLYAAAWKEDAKGSPCSRGFTYTEDSTSPPAPMIRSAPASPIRSTAATFTFTDAETAAFRCRLDGGPFSDCSAGSASYSGLAEGAHTFAVKAVDRAGNESNVAPHTWTIRTTQRDHSPPGNVRRLVRNVSYRLLELRWSNPRDADFDHVNVYVSTSAKKAARRLVFSGRARRYRDYRFKNGLYYRYRVVSYDRAGNASPGVPKPVPPSVLLLSPRQGQVVHSPPHLRWTGVPHATFYNVQLYRGGRKILSAWPAKARFGLRRSWTDAGRRFRLGRGTYQWYVWPAFGPRSASHYGQLLGQGSFRVGSF